MSEHEQGGKLIPLRASDAGSAVAFEEKPDAPAYIDTTGTGGGRRDIIPEHLTRAHLPETLGTWAGKSWYQFRYHAIRSPWHAIWLTWLAHRGAGRLIARLLAWANWAEGWILESQAVAAGRAGHHEAMRAHTEGKKTRGQRWRITGACAAAALVTLIAAWRFTRWWGIGPLAGIAFPVLVWHGRPYGKPIIGPAILPPAYSVPTPEIITRALGALNIAAISKVIDSGTGIAWVSDVHRDGDGWGVEFDLPYGVTAKMIIQRREQLSSGLRRPLSAVWPEAVPGEHEGRVFLWIGRHDLARAKPPAHPLLKSGHADIFEHVPFAAVPRGTGIGVPVFESNWLIGATMGNGKTAAVRDLLAAAALDPVCDLWTHEFSGKGDLEPFAQVSYRYCSGLDDEAVAYAAESAARLRRELEKRAAIFKKLPKAAKPTEGKLTRELAKADRRLRPIVATFDEVQNVVQHPEYGPQFTADIAHVMRLGRAYGIIIILATQRPDKTSIPTAITGVVAIRFCMKVPDQVANDLILGTGAYHAGFNAVVFRHGTDAGLGWLRGTGDPQAVRTYYLDLPAAAKIAARARAVRQAAGALSGYALGEDDDQSPRNVLADVLSTFGPGESGLHWQVVAGRLAVRYPERWAGATADAVSAQCRDLGVPSAGVRFPSTREGRVLAGCRRADVEAAAVAS
jgi:S-DNA-T family DNA segregation ATPase FtsK/SpoIIIE